MREINTKTGYPVECARIEVPRSDSAVLKFTEQPITRRDTITLPNGKDISMCGAHRITITPHYDKFTLIEE